MSRFLGQGLPVAPTFTRHGNRGIVRTYSLPWASSGIPAQTCDDFRSPATSCCLQSIYNHGAWLSLDRALRSGRRGRRFKSFRPDFLIHCEETTYGDTEVVKPSAENTVCTRVCTNCGRLLTIPDSKKAAFAAVCRLATEMSPTDRAALIEFLKTLE